MLKQIPNLANILKQKNFVRDNIVMNLFNFDAHRTFLDVGTTSNTCHSGSYLLEVHYKWQGFCIETNLEKLYHLEQFRSCEVFSPMEINSIYLKNLWLNDDIPKKIDYLNINVENTGEVFDSIDFDKFQFGTISFFSNTNKFDRLLWSNSYSRLVRYGNFQQFVSEKTLV